MVRSWFDRFRSLWRRIFFWQTPPDAQTSEEFIPHPHHDHALVLAVTSPRRVPRWKQLRFINRVLAEPERRMFWGAFLVFLLAVSLGVGSLLRVRLERVPAAGGEFTEALVGSPKLINPLYASRNNVDGDLVALLYSGLFRLDEGLAAQPDLVEQYQWLDGGKTLEVRLRADARFHDGQPLTADDVKFTYDAIKNPDWRSPLESLFRDVHVVRVDDLTVQFQIPRPNALFMNELTVGILPAHVWNDVDPSNATLADANLKPIGSGPYQVASFTRDGNGLILYYSLKRFPAYHGLKPFIDNLRFRFYGDRDQALLALNNGQVDALSFVPWSEAVKGRADHVRPVSLDLPYETVTFFNTKDRLLKDEKLRHALSLAVDTKELAALIGEHAKPVSSPFPFLEDVSSTVPDLDAARAELDKLGWKLPEGGSVRQLTASSTLALTIDVPNQTDLMLVADHLKRRWSLLGAEVTVRADDAEPLLRDALASRTYQVLVWNVLMPADQDLTRFWSSQSTSGRVINLSNISDRTIDDALERARSASSTADLVTAQRDLSAAIRSRSAAIFLLRPSYAYLIAKRVLGVNDMRISIPSDRLLHIGDWFVKQGYRWK